jgi:hypothetical protein
MDGQIVPIKIFPRDLDPIAFSAIVKKPKSGSKKNGGKKTQKPKETTN